MLENQNVTSDEAAEGIKKTEDIINNDLLSNNGFHLCDNDKQRVLEIDSELEVV